MPADAGDIREADSIPGSEKSWRRAWQPTLGCLPGESHGQRSLMGYSPWGHKESDRTTGTACTRALGWKERDALEGWVRTTLMLIPLFYEGPCKPGLHWDDSLLLFPSHTTMGDLSPPDYFLSFKNTFYTFHISPLAGIFKFWRMVTIISPQDTLLPTGQRERGPMLSVSLIDACGDSLSSTIANLKRKLGMRLSSRLSVDSTSASSSKRHVPVFFLDYLQAWDTLSRWVFIFFGVSFVCSRVEKGPFFPFHMALLLPTGNSYHPYPSTIIIVLAFHFSFSAPTWP